MNLFRPYTPKDGYTPLVKPGKDGIEFLEVGVLRLPAGGAYRSASEASEVAIVLLGGLANVTVAEVEFLSIGGRAHVFSGRATTVHIPPGCKFKVEAVGTVEAIIAKSPSDLPGEPRLIGPEKVKVVHPREGHLRAASPRHHRRQLPLQTPLGRRDLQRARESGPVIPRTSTTR